MWNKLLVPHDFSACSARALRLALDLARVHGSELTLVHVSELPPNLPPDTLVTPVGAASALRVDDYTTGGARRQLEDIAEPLRREGIHVRTLAVTGDAPEEILAAARAVGADAIVVGTHGRSGLSHLLLGSVAEKVVRGSPVPVVSVRSQAPEPLLTHEEKAVEDELAG
jgi:universal stress protein A